MPAHRRLVYSRNRAMLSRKPTRRNCLDHRTPSPRCEHSQRQFEESRATELRVLNEQLQAKLLEVGTAHRMASCTTLAKEREAERCVTHAPTSPVLQIFVLLFYA